MSSIDERVVQMKFDNSQFQKGVSETNSALDSLKKGLNLDASAKSLEGLNSAGSKFSLAGIANGVQELSSKFSAMSIIGITALTNIANKAIDSGLQFAKSFTVAPIMDGFNEYELKMGSIQTILANTAKDGTTLKDVSASLEELNKYADKTIYNFGDMTRNIGLFTNAGIKLQDATSMIKGFSNEAAMSGTTSAAASGAAYQLSQALSKGKVTLEDFKSLTNVGMGNANMKNGLIEIATAMGTVGKAGLTADGITKDFNGSLEKGWITTDVMQNYLKIQAGDFNAEQMKSLGLTEDQIANFVKMQKIAEESATKVRTWTALMGTLKEAVGSGWATTWELLIGDFDKATELFTKVSNTLGKIAGDAGDARNNLIKGWADGGGRVALIDALSSAFDTLMSILKVVGEAYRDIFPPVTVSTLISLTNKFKAFIDGLKPGPEALNNIKRTFKGLFAVVDIGWYAIQLLWGVFQRLFKGMDGAGSGLLGLTARFGDFLVKVHDTILNSEKLNAFFVGLSPILRVPGEALNWLIGMFKKALDVIQGFKLSSIKIDTSGMSAAVDNLKHSLSKLQPTGEAIAKVWEGLRKIFEGALSVGKQLGNELAKAFSGLGKGMSDGMGKIDFTTILGILGTGMLGGIVLMVKKFFKFVKGAVEDMGSGGGLLDSVKEAFGGLTDTLGAMQATLKASTLILIAGAIALLTLSVVELSKVDQSKLAGSLAAITVMFTQLSVGMAVLGKMNFGTSLTKLVLLGGAMILLAVAIRILVGAVKELGDLDWQQLLKGLVGVTALLGGLAGAARLMPNDATKMITTGIGMIAIAVAIKILASATKDFSGLSWDEIARGLTGVGAVLAALTLFTKFAEFNKGAVGSSVGLILLGVALKVMASAVGDFAAYDSKQLEKGLGSIGAVLTGLALFTKAVNPESLIATGIAMVILGGALKIIASVVGDFANMDFESLKRGLGGMGGALLILTLAMNLMPKDMLVTAAALVVVGVALKIIASAFKDMGGMSWDEIGKGFVVLAGSLAILAGAMYLMEFGLPGAAAMLVMAAALAIFVPILKDLGNMSWDEIGKGLGALAASLAVLGTAGAVLGILSPLFILFGAAMILVGTGMLLAGIGTLAFAAGLTALSAAGAVGGAVLITMVTAMLALIPYAFTQIGLGLVAFAKVIGDNIPVFVNLGVQLLTGLLDGIRQVAPVIGNFIIDMLLMLLNLIADNIQQFVDAGMRIIIGLLNGIAGQIGNVVTAATNLIVSFINSMADNNTRVIDAGGNLIIKLIEGIGNKLGEIANAAAKAVVKFVNEVAAAVENNSQALNTAGARLAGAIVDGMTGGLASKVKDVAAGAWEMGQKAIAAIKGAIDSNSPSKETFKLGGYFGDGFVNGIASLGGQVVKTAAGVGNAAVEALKTTIASTGNAISMNMDMAPVIRPVLDLSAIKKDSGLIGGMLTPPTIDLGSTYAMATALSEATRGTREAQPTPASTVVDPSSVGSVHYTQNNYSPKALSPAEIYRNTKNQISVAKGALVN